jgi:mono/diheme cytochrome c family protein
MASWSLRLASVVPVVWLVLGYGSEVQAAPPPAVVFSSRCSSCHNVGKGDLVGPDLKGVTSRHNRDWLHRFIHSSQSVVRSGDPQATALFKRYGRQVMPDHPLSDPEIDALLAYIEAGGPAEEGEMRLAIRATAAEVRRGRDLFLGRVKLAHGGPACIHCHAAGAADPLAAGTLAPDLTQVYLKYRDWGMKQALERPQIQFPMMSDLYGERPLTSDETYALTAFLYRTAHAPARAADSTSPARTAAFLGFGVSALLFWWTDRRRGGRKP